MIFRNENIDYFFKRFILIITIFQYLGFMKTKIFVFII